MPNFDTPAPITATVDIPAGRVSFIAADRADTTVEVLPANASKNRDVEAAQQTTVEYADGVLRVHAPMKSQLGNPGSIEVTVQLPTGSQIKAKAASAQFSAVGRFGDVAIDGAHGAVKLDEAVSARLTAHAGDITVGRLHGSAEVSTSKGDIRITEATRGNLVLRTQAGNVTVGVAQGVSATLDAGTTLGRINNTLKNADAASADLKIHATTSLGDITAHSL